MIVYIKRFENKQPIYQILRIFKIVKIEDKTYIQLPINKNSKTRKTEKIFEKLGKYLYKNSIKNVVLEKELMENEEAKNILYKNNINILDGTKLSKYLIYQVIQKIYEYKSIKIETSEITILANENDEITIQTIKQIAKNVKRLNIITNNIRKFRKIVEQLYEELGIIIKLSNNFKTNLKNSELIVNMDFPEEFVNKLSLPVDVTILNIPKNINITSKKFAGVNIKLWKNGIPNKYKISGFDENIIYEAMIYRKAHNKSF